MIVQRNFPLETNEKDPKLDSGLIHQIRCQMRLRNLDILSQDVEKIMELKNCIDKHQVTIVTGPEFCGKTSAVDILSMAINNTIYPSQTHRFGNKNRGAIEVIKSMSNDKKLQIQLEEVLGQNCQSRIYQQRLTLSNFESRELWKSRFVNGNENPAGLASVIEPLVKLKATDKFQIWICIETNVENWKSHLSILKSCVDPHMKIILELGSLKPCQLHELSAPCGIVQLDIHNNVLVTILEQKLKSLLTMKMISYYGSKYLLETGNVISTKLLECLKIQMEASQEKKLSINFIIQTLDILEIIFLRSKELMVDEQELIPNLERKYNSFLVFSMIQGARGLLYSVLVKNRFISHEEFEICLKNSLSPYYDDIVQDDDDLNAGIFGLMIDFETMMLKPFQSIKGCKLPPYWSCADGVANYIIQLLLNYDKSVFLNGPLERTELFLESIRYSKRLRLNNDFPLANLRKVLHEKQNEDMKLVTNKDILSTNNSDKDIIVIEDFLTDPELSVDTDTFFQFVLEHKYFFDADSDGISFTRISFENSIMIFTKQDESNFWKLRKSRWVAVVSIIDPDLTEAKLMIYKVIYPWICQVPKQNTEFSKIFATKISNFIIDVGVTIQKYQRHQLLVNVCNSTKASVTPISTFPQNWIQTTLIVKSLTSLPIEMFIEIFQNLESKFPLESQLRSKTVDENNESLKVYKSLRNRIRIIRYLISIVSRFWIDPLNDQTVREYVNSTIMQHVEANFIQTSSFEIDEILLKSFPLPVDTLTDIMMVPSRLCQDITNEQSTHYQPVVENHSWKLLQIINDNIFKTNAIEKHMLRSRHLKSILGSHEFLENLMKMYKHVSGYSLTRSSLIIRHSSSFISGSDWGYFLSGLIQAKYIPVEICSNISPQFVYDMLRTAMNQAGKGGQKVLFHIDSNLIYFKREMCELLIGILQTDSFVALLQFLQTPFVHRSIHRGHKDMYIKAGSVKEDILSRIFLENIQKNLKILITIHETDLKSNENVVLISDWFLKNSRGYLVINNDDGELLTESLDNMLPILTKSYSENYRLLADAHLYFDDYFYQYVQHFWAPFYINGQHLQMCISLYDFLYNRFNNGINEKIEKLQLGIQLVNEAQVEIENFKHQQNILEDNLEILKKQIDDSANEVKKLRNNYGMALIQCENQEKLIAELEKPLNDLKENSNSNLQNVSSSYMAALDAIRNLDIAAVEEIKTYIKPPQPVQELVETIFYLLGYDKNWEEIKEIMVRINLFEELLYFDKDHISDNKYKYVLGKLQNTNLHPEHLINISQAASSLSGWLIATFKYSSLSRDINPQLGELLSFQDRLSMAQSECGRMKVRADMMRQELELKFQDHKELMSRKNDILKHLKDIAYKIDSGKNLLSDLNPHFEGWMNKIKDLNQEREDLSLNVIVFVINNVYLSRFPYTLRIKMLNKFREGFHQNNKLKYGIFEEQDSKCLVDNRLCHSVSKVHIENAFQLATVVCCPSICFPNFGSMILVHCHNDSSGNSISILKKVLESKLISNMRTDSFGSKPNAQQEIVQYVDCSKTSCKTMDVILKNSMEIGTILVIEKVELLNSLTECLQLLLYGMTNEKDVPMHSDFRLVLVTREMYSQDDKTNVLWSSTRIVHYEFSGTIDDVKEYILMSSVESCQLKLFDNFMECERKMFEIKLFYNIEKDSIINSITNCCTKQCSNDTNDSQQEHDSSLLSIRNFHSELLGSDSKLLNLEESYETMKKKYSDLQNSLGLYSEISKAICSLLYNCGIFTFDHMFNEDQETSITLAIRSFGLKEMLEVVKTQTENEMKSLAPIQNVDAEISEEFLLKLKLSILSSLVMNIDSKMEPDLLKQSVLAFCVDLISNEQKDVCDEIEHNVSFIKQALVCQNINQLQTGSSESVLEFIHSQVNDDISKEILYLSLVIETNMGSLTGLSKSIAHSQQLWKEYFKFPFINSNRMPGFSVGNQPGLLEKAVVWRLLNPVKVNEIQSVLIAHVFGEDIFRWFPCRTENLRGIILTTSPKQPVILSTNKETIDATVNPMYIIESCHQNLGTSSKIVYIDCANLLETKNILSESGDSFENENPMSIVKLSKEPNWLILYNAHLYGCEIFENENALHYFFHDTMKNILKYVTNQHLSQIHSDFKVFIVLEKGKSFQYPEIIFENAITLHFRQPINLERRFNDGTGIITKTDITSKIFSAIHFGILGDESFQKDFTGTQKDIVDIYSIGSIISQDFSNIFHVIQLIYGNKILGKEKLLIFNNMMTELYSLFNDFSKRNISEVVLIRTIQDVLGQNICCQTKSVDEDFHRPSLNDGIIWDQRLLHVIRSRFINICSQLHNIGNSLLEEHADISQIYLKKLAKNIYNFMVNLPVWSVEVISNSRFESNTASNDVNRLIDQHLLSNDKFPKSWDGIHHQELSVSSWLDHIDDLIDKMKILTTSNDGESLQILLQKITDLFVNLIF